MASDTLQPMCHQQAHSSNKVIDGVPSRGPRRIIGTHVSVVSRSLTVEVLGIDLRYRQNLSLKQLLYMEQSVEDISEIFYRVDCVLGDIDESDTTSTALLRQSWEELQQVSVDINVVMNNICLVSLCRTSGRLPRDVEEISTML